MHAHLHSHRRALEILEHDKHRGTILDPVLNAVAACPHFKRVGKSKKNDRLDTDQKQTNRYFADAFARSPGWSANPLVTPDDDSSNRLRSDFAITVGDLGVLVEVQFGNAARAHSDFTKFQIGSVSGRYELGIMILPTRHFATQIDSNVANFERACTELGKLRLAQPLLLIGMEPDAATTVVDLTPRRAPLRLAA